LVNWLRSSLEKKNVVAHIWAPFWASFCFAFEHELCSYKICSYVRQEQQWMWMVLEAVHKKYNVLGWIHVSSWGEFGWIYDA